MDFATRVGTAGDAATLATLLTAFNHEFDAPVPEHATLTTRFARLLDEPTVLVVLAETSDAIGFALVTMRPTPYHDGPLAQLDELYVIPELRSRGIGTQILSEAIAGVTMRGVHEMHINVDEIDEDTRRFYERHGFTNIEPGADYRMLCYIKEF